MRKKQFISAMRRWIIGFCLICGLGFGCLGGSENSGLPEPKDFDPHLFIETGPDTFYYPDRQWFSSYRFPLTRYGPDQMTDGNLTTYWSTSTGLNDGEGFDFSFEPGKMKSMKIWAAEDPYLARIHQFEIWQNDSLLGYFQSGQDIIFTRPLRHLRVRILVQDGWNHIQLPLENEEGSIQRVNRSLAKLFNSRPAGIAELTFFDGQGKPIPFQPQPIRMAAIRLLGVGDPLDKYFMYDHGPHGQVRGGASGEERRMVYTFPDWTPLLKLSLEKDVPHPLNVQVLLSDGPPKNYEWTSNRQVFEIDSLSVQKGFTLVVQPKDVADVPFSFGQLKAWSGKRWWVILPDSLETEPERRWSHLKKTVLADWINQPLVYKESWAQYQEALPGFVEPEDALIHVPQATHGKELTFWMRSMGTFALKTNQWKTTESGTTQYWSLFSGRWYWTPDQPKQLGLEGWYVAHSVSGKVGFSKQWYAIQARLDEDRMTLPAPWSFSFPLRR